MSKELTKELLYNLFEYRDGSLIRKKDAGTKWKAGQIVGSPHSNGLGYINVKFNGRTYFLHRLIFLMHHGYLPQFVDHIDGNPSNNKIENLRAASRSENAWNYKKPSTNKSGYKNVSFAKNCNKWRVRIGVKSSKYNVGLFDTLEEAANAAEQFREAHHGAFANHG